MVCYPPGVALLLEGVQEVDKGAVPIRAVSIVRSDHDAHQWQVGSSCRQQGQGQGQQQQQQPAVRRLHFAGLKCLQICGVDHGIGPARCFAKQIIDIIFDSLLLTNRQVQTTAAVDNTQPAAMHPCTTVRICWLCSPPSLPVTAAATTPCHQVAAAAAVAGP